MMLFQSAPWVELENMCCVNSEGEQVSDISLIHVIRREKRMKVLNDDKTLALSYRTESTKEQSRGMRLTESDVGRVVEGVG